MLGQAYAGRIHLARGENWLSSRVCDASMKDTDPLICHRQKPIAAIMTNTYTRAYTYTHIHYIASDISSHCFSELKAILL